MNNIRCTHISFASLISFDPHMKILVLPISAKQKGGLGRGGNWTEPHASSPHGQLRFILRQEMVELSIFFHGEHA